MFKNNYIFCGLILLFVLISSCSKNGANYHAHDDEYIGPDEDHLRGTGNTQPKPDKKPPKKDEPKKKDTNPSPEPGTKKQNINQPPKEETTGKSQIPEGAPKKENLPGSEPVIKGNNPSVHEQGKEEEKKKEPIITKPGTESPALNTPKIEPEPKKKEEIPENITSEKKKEIIDELKKGEINWFNEKQVENLTKSIDKELITNVFKIKKPWGGDIEGNFAKAMLSGIKNTRKKEDVDAITQSLDKIFSSEDPKTISAILNTGRLEEDVEFLLSDSDKNKSALKLLNKYGFNAGKLYDFTVKKIEDGKFRGTDVYELFYEYLHAFKDDGDELFKIYNNLVIKEKIFEYSSLTELCSVFIIMGSFKTRFKDFKYIFKSIYEKLNDEEKKQFRSKFIFSLLTDLKKNFEKNYRYTLTEHTILDLGELMIEYFKHISLEIIQKSSDWGFNAISDKFILPDNSETNILYFMMKSVEGLGYEKYFYPVFFSSDKEKEKYTFKHALGDKWQEYLTDEVRKLYLERTSVLFPQSTAPAVDDLVKKLEKLVDWTDEGKAKELIELINKTIIDEKSASQLLNSTIKIHAEKKTFLQVFINAMLLVGDDELRTKLNAVLDKVLGFIKKDDARLIINKLSPSDLKHLSGNNVEAIKNFFKVLEKYGFDAQ